MSDLIRASELLKQFYCEQDEGRLIWGIDRIEKTILTAPTVEAKPVVHGEWLEFDIDYGGIPTVGYQCSECGQSNGFITDFCPNCGCDMRKKVE